MADTRRTLAALQALLADNTAGDISAQDIRDMLVSLVVPNVNDFRLTTESGVPVSTSDRTSQGTLYLTPYKGNCISLYTGSVWETFFSAEVSLALSGLTSAKNYDVFAYNNSGTLALELSAAWTNDTTRADALDRQDGVWVKSGAGTHRWVGTIRTTGTTTTEDSERRRFVYNAENRVPRVNAVTYATSHGYNTNTTRQWNSVTTNQIEHVLGAPQTAEVTVTGSMNGQGALAAAGLDSTTAETVFTIAPVGNLATLSATTPYPMTLGYHFWSLNQRSSSALSVTWNPSNVMASVKSTIQI